MSCNSDLPPSDLDSEALFSNDADSLEMKSKNSVEGRRTGSDRTVDAIRAEVFVESYLQQLEDAYPELGRIRKLCESVELDLSGLFLMLGNKKDGKLNLKNFSMQLKNFLRLIFHYWKKEAGVHSNVFPLLEGKDEVSILAKNFILKAKNAMPSSYVVEQLFQLKQAVAVFDNRLAGTVNISRDFKNF